MRHFIITLAPSSGLYVPPKNIARAAATLRAPRPPAPSSALYAPPKNSARAARAPAPALSDIQHPPPPPL
jgi:hypothetical protein